MKRMIFPIECAFLLSVCNKLGGVIYHVRKLLYYPFFGYDTAI